MKQDVKSLNDCAVVTAIQCYGNGMHVCVFMAPITNLVLCARSQDLVMSVSVRRVHVVSRLLDIRAEESRVVRHVKPPCCGKASRRPRALSWVPTQAIECHWREGSYPLSYSSALMEIVLNFLKGKYILLQNQTLHAV